jgi:hypothetical protein
LRDVYTLGHVVFHTQTAGACYEMIGQRDFTFQDQDFEIFCFGQQCHILKPFLSCLTGFAGRFDFLAHSHLARSKK